MVQKILDLLSQINDNYDIDELEELRKYSSTSYPDKVTTINNASLSDFEPVFTANT